VFGGGIHYGLWRRDPIVRLRDRSRFFECETAHVHGPGEDGHAAADELARATEWLAEARRRCVRETDVYTALQVEILADQVEIARRQGRFETADGFAREWVSLAARTHMNGHVARAAGFIAREQPAKERAG